MCYLDDMLLLGSSYEQYAVNVQETGRLLTELGFVINVKKSNMVLTKEIQMFGVVLNSVTTCISLYQKTRGQIYEQSVRISVKTKIPR